MLFQETETPGVYRDEKGEMWPLGADMVTKLRNNGNVFMGGQSSSGGGDGGAKVGIGPAWAPNPVERVGAAVPSAQAPVKMGLGPAFAVQPGSGGSPPLQAPVKRDFEAVPQQGGSDWQFNGAPRQPSGVQQLPSQPMLSRVSQAQPGTQQQGSPQIQRVMPRDRSQGQAPQDQRYYKQTGGSPGGWVDTARQTSGISEEQQQSATQRAFELRDAQMEAAKEDALAAGAIHMGRRFQAEREAVENQNRAVEEQRKLDTQNLYIQNQQQKVAERLKAAREQQVDPTKPFQGGGGLAGVLAVLGSALGEYSSKINGGPNNALMLFNNMIERSTSEQLRRINEEKEGALMAKSELDDFQFRNDEEKKALIRSIEQERVAAELRRVAADEALISIHPAAKQALADIDGKLNDNLMQVNSAINRTAGQRYQQETRGGVVDVTEKVLAQQAKEASYRKSIAEDTQAVSGGGAADKGAVLVNGQVIGKTTDAAAKELNDQYRAYVTLKQKRDQAVDMIRNGSFLDDSRYEALTNDAMFDLAGAKGATIRSDTDVKQFGDMLGGTSRAKIRPENQIKIWNDNVRRAGTAVRNSFRQRGLPTNDIEPDELLPTE